jgi:nucleoside-diphosphate-sugar epimerase
VSDGFDWKKPPSDGAIVVTGGAGYIGSHVVRKLLCLGHRVRVVDTFLYSHHGLGDLVGHPRLHLLRADIRDRVAMASAVRGAAGVVALAALVGDAACDVNVAETMSINVDSTAVLIDVCRDAKTPRVLFSSSCSVYGASDTGLLDEDADLNPVSLYARTRIESEGMLAKSVDDLNFTIFRLATVFGLSSRMRLDLFVNAMTASGVRDRRIRVFGGAQWRPNVHVQDVADAFVEAVLKRGEALRGQTINIGDESLNHTVLDVAELIREEIPGVTLELNPESADRRNYRIACAKVRSLLRFRCRRTVRDGVREVSRAVAEADQELFGDDRYHNFRWLQSRGIQSTTEAFSAGRA